MSRLKLSFEIWPNMPYGELPIVGPVTNTWGDKSIAWCIDRIAQYGYEGVDLFFDKFLFELEHNDEDSIVREIREALKNTGIAFHSIGAHYLTITPRWWEREEGVKMFKKAVDVASKVEANTVCSYIRGGFYDPPTYVIMSYEKAWNILVKIVKDVAKYAHEKNMNITIEPHAGSILQTVPESLKLIEDVGYDNVYICADTGPAFEICVKPFMSIKEAVKMLGDRLNVVHLKDLVGHKGFWKMVWYGGGVVNFDEWAEALKTINYRYFSTVEWEGWFVGGFTGVGEIGGVGLSDFDRAAKEALEFLKKHGFG